MKIFDGKKSATAILEEIKENVSKSKKIPKIAVILVGQSRESKLYIRIKREAAHYVGIKIEEYDFKERTKEADIIQKIISLNCDKSVDGLIVQLPLPEGFDAEKIISTIAPEKDVDGFHKINRRLLEKGKPFFYPVLPLAIFTSLKCALKDAKNKKIFAVVNSEVFGETLRNFFKREKIKINYVLLGKISSSRLKARTQSADVIISVCGFSNLIKGDMIKDGAILIDAGMRFENKKKLKGDIDRESVKGKASFLTPVPGGIGPLTVAFLLKNVYLATKHHTVR